MYINNQKRGVRKRNQQNESSYKKTFYRNLWFVGKEHFQYRSHIFIKVECYIQTNTFVK